MKQMIFWEQLPEKSEQKGMDIDFYPGDRDLLQLATDKVMIRLQKPQRARRL